MACTVLTSNYSASHMDKVRYLIVIEMVFSDYTKQQKVFNSSKGLLSTSIVKELCKEGIKASVVGIWKFLKRYKDLRTIDRQAVSEHPTHINTEIKTAIESRMEKDDETTAVQLRTLLLLEGHTLSLSTIQRAHSHHSTTTRVDLPG